MTRFRMSCLTLLPLLAVSRELFRRILKTGVALALICAFLSKVEFSSPAKTKNSCDFLRTWLSQDVGYIIPDAERTWAREAQKSEDCHFAIQQFWTVRDPTPETINNEFKEEFYDRILYANAHFGKGDRIGWKTDRGRMYIVWGPPERVETGKRRVSSETWHYLNKEKHYGLEGSIEFEDLTGNGDYEIIANATAKQALSRIPNTRSDTRELPHGTAILCGRPPQIQFKDLEIVLNARLAYNLLPFTCRTEYVPATDCTVLASITVEIRKEDLVYKDARHNQPETARIFGIVRKDGKALEVFEGTLPAISLQNLRESPSADFLAFKKVVPLLPGTYGLELAIRDVTTGNLGTRYRTITIP